MVKNVIWELSRWQSLAHPVLPEDDDPDDVGQSPADPLQDGGGHRVPGVQHGEEQDVVGTARVGRVVSAGGRSESSRSRGRSGHQGRGPAVLRVATG